MQLKNLDLKLKSIAPSPLFLCEQIYKLKFFSDIIFRNINFSADLCEGYASDQGYNRVCAFISTQLTEDLALKLFDLVPGLAYARLTDEKVSTNGKGKKNVTTI